MHRSERNLNEMDALGELQAREELHRWCESGLLALTGHAEAPAPPPPGLVEGLDRLVHRFASVTERRGRRAAVRWEELVLGRAALRALHRAGRRSANGSCRLLAAADGWVALNLPRDDDLALLPALLEDRLGDDLDTSLNEFAASVDADALVDRARLLGMAAARLGSTRGGPAVSTSELACGRAPTLRSTLRVVDLSSMWAGPLCAHLLSRAGAEVIKVESATRPDGARQDQAFYAWLHGDDESSLVIDFDTRHGRDELRSLLEGADVVIESSRPRALVQLGLAPEMLTLAAGAVWVSITGHGRGSGSMAIAFGDDAAVAGGLVGTDVDGSPVFCGDAIADPITGLVAATSALEALEGGGGVLLDVAMARAAASVLKHSLTVDPPRWHVAGGREHELLILDGQVLEVHLPRLPVGAGGR